MHVKKICDVIAPLESKFIRILIEEEKILENFYLLEITESLLQAYRKVHQEISLTRELDTGEVLDEDDDEPPEDYGDQSYDQRTCIYVLNRDTLEREYNMTHMNFFNSNFFNLKQQRMNKAAEGKNGLGEIELGSKKTDAEVFENGKYEQESTEGLKKFKDDFFPKPKIPNRSEPPMLTEGNA